MVATLSTITRVPDNQGSRVIHSGVRSQRGGPAGVRTPERPSFGVRGWSHQTEKLDETCQVLITGALNDPKNIRKASADIFANSEPAKPENNERIITDREHIANETKTTLSSFPCRNKAHPEGEDWGFALNGF